MSKGNSTPSLFDEVDPEILDARKRRLKWYYKNRDKANADNKKWREANRERRNAARRKWAAKPKNKAKLKAAHDEWLKRNPEKKAASAKRYQIKHKDHLKVLSRRNHLRREYGLTIEQFEAMLAAQSGLCAICQTDNPAPSPVMCVDHCHKTGAVRGLLCFNCNISIGRMRDDPELLAAAIRYLKTCQRDSRAAHPPVPRAG